jgi:two-component system, NtrC family, nitrogen regulation response regulator NtrX
MMQVLIVDDEQNIRLALRDILEDDGFEVAEAVDGAQGLRHIEQSGADIVLLDVKLPGRNGVAILKDIKKRWPNVEVIMISGHSGIETAVGALRSGAYDFLEKPLSLPKVRVVIGHVTEKLNLWRRAQEAAQGVYHEMIGSSASLDQIRGVIDRVATTNATVLVTGESGTGKELIAERIHRCSPSPDSPYVQVNCAAIPHELIESELFGHEKGAFTGASAKRIGKFEQADGGTLFLDEVGDMDVAVQAKVLRALQNGEFQRVGGNETLFANVRIVVATNKDLETEVSEGRFREDLFYRLNVVPIHLPPLRERPEDVPELARHFLAGFCAENGREALRFSDDAIQRLSRLEFRGNVRELKNLVERLAIFAVEPVIGTEDLATVTGAVSAGTNTLFMRTQPLGDAKAELERLYIETQLGVNDWDIPATAKALSILPNNLHRKITQLGIERPQRSEDE